MDATILRRYLQPSPTLRWHPWAPLIAGLAMLLFVVFFSARWGYSVAKEEQVRQPQAAGVAFVMANFISQKWPARAMVYEAEAVDNLVLQGANSNPPGTANAPDRWRETIEAQVFRNGHRVHTAGLSDARLAAEQRLRVFSSENPAWVQTTASFCKEMAMPLDLRQRYGRAALAYSQVLGRAVRPEELAPAVPEMKCSA